MKITLICQKPNPMICDESERRSAADSATLVNTPPRRTLGAFHDHRQEASMRYFVIDLLLLQRHARADAR
jgi:hypothetical protein